MQRGPEGCREAKQSRSGGQGCTGAPALHPKALLTVSASQRQRDGVVVSGLRNTFNLLT
jgi:hypothetical protein